MQHALVVAQRQPVGPPRRLQHRLVTEVLGCLEIARALALGTAPVDRVLDGPLEIRLECHRIGGCRRRVGQANRPFQTIPLLVHDPLLLYYTHLYLRPLNAYTHASTLPTHDWYY